MFGTVSWEFTNQREQTLLATLVKFDAIFSLNQDLLCDLNISAFRGFILILEAVLLYPERKRRLSHKVIVWKIGIADYAEPPSWIVRLC
jgi:hypothetical protein